MSGRRMNFWGWVAVALAVGIGCLSVQAGTPSKRSKRHITTKQGKKLGENGGGFTKRNTDAWSTNATELNKDAVNYSDRSFVNRPPMDRPPQQPPVASRPVAPRPQQTEAAPVAAKQDGGGEAAESAGATDATETGTTAGAP